MKHLAVLVGEGDKTEIGFLTSQGRAKLAQLRSMDGIHEVPERFTGRVLIVKVIDGRAEEVKQAIRRLGMKIEEEQERSYGQ